MRKVHRDSGKEKEAKERTLKVYLAAKYERRLEICTYRDNVRAIGSHEVTSRWLDGEEHKDVAALQMYARRDLEDIWKADLLIAFTEDPETLQPRGGRHFEAGYAHAHHKEVWLLPFREHIFHWLPEARLFSEWEECLVELANRKHL